MAASTKIGYVVGNVGAVNNSPLEYIPDDPEIVEALRRVEGAMGSGVACAEVLPQNKLEMLWLKLALAGHDLEVVQALWESIKEHPVADVLKSDTFTKKRLASMPDRKTNKDRPAMTTAASVGDFASWWETVYVPFWFEGPSPAIDRLGALKYDTLTPEEKQASVSLQILGIALFDCALMHFSEQASPDGELLRIKASLVTDRAAKIVAMVVDMVRADPDAVVFLHEVDNEVRKGLEDTVRSHSHHYSVVKGNQMSAILVPPSWKSLRDLTKWIHRRVEYDPQATVAMLLESPTGENVIAASIHADTDGAISIPMIQAVVDVRGDDTKTKVIIGIDANTVAMPKGDKLTLDKFVAAAASSGLVTCHGDRPDPSKHYTSKKRRSVFQTQLAKAVSLIHGDGAYEEEVKIFLLTDRGARVENTRLLGDDGAACPNPRCPSDHFPQAGVVRFE